MLATAQSSHETVADDPWGALRHELDRWAEAGRDATFWWRDDDATSRTGALDRLLDLRRELDVPLALAIVPRAMDASLPETLSDCTDAVTALQHGYAHQNHAGGGEKSIEMAATRPTEHVLAELAQGLQNLQALPAHMPVLVPPWNRIAPHLIPLLPEIGLTGLSTFGARQRRQPTPASVAANTHIDPIVWRYRRAFVGASRSLGTAIDHLRRRRQGDDDRDEPTGLLTHHLVMDEDTWAFAREFVRQTQSHGAGRWLSPQAIFAPRFLAP